MLTNLRLDFGFACLWDVFPVFLHAGCVHKYMPFLLSFRTEVPGLLKVLLELIFSEGFTGASFLGSTCKGFDRVQEEREEQPGNHPEGSDFSWFVQRCWLRNSQRNRPRYLGVRDQDTFQELRRSWQEDWRQGPWTEEIKMLLWVR